MKKRIIPLIMVILLSVTACMGGNKKPVAGDKNTNSSVVQEESSDKKESFDTTTTTATESPVPETTTTTTAAETSAPETTTTAVETPIPETTTTVAETPAPETTTTVVTEPPTPQWTEEAVDETFYITVDCYERQGAYVGAPSGSVLKKGAEVKVIAKTDTDYYKMENGRFVHKDYLSKTKPSDEAVQPAANDFKTLINKAKLTPTKTNNETLDKLVEKILAEIITDDMTNYEKVKAAYDYIIANSTYGGGIIFWNDLLEFIGDKAYISRDDIEIIYMSHEILTTGVGVCDYYAAAFTVLTRAIGVESYWVGGQVAYSGGGYTGHRWNNIKVGDKWFEFDAQIEDKYNEINGYTSYSFWGRERGANTIYIYPDDLSAIESNFGKFRLVP